jgi:hypothetical protein
MVLLPDRPDHDGLPPRPPHAPRDVPDADLEAWLDDEFPLGDGVADDESTVFCPYCGEPNQIGLDPGSGAEQAYIEDCQVCCQPWSVVVRYQSDGSAVVTVNPADGD